TAEGTLFLEEGRPEKAVEYLTEALRLLIPFARAVPLLRPHQSRLEARLGLAYAAIGDTMNGRKYIGRAKPLLIAHQEHDLLRQCEQAAG
ncbi:MAG TPA: hypothetical protein VKD71_04385, partial [Gemmataceae bacterium]|nr:hypothetical protein [Gemmataceae bacterium]